MPKDQRSKLTQRHQPSAKRVSRVFAVPDEQTEKIDKEKELSGLSANELLRTTVTQLSTDLKAPIHVPTKKDKKQAKHERLLQRLATGTSPYSKSHNRRLKRKQKAELSTDLQSVQKALNTIADEVLPSAIESSHDPEDRDSTRLKPAPGMIGEGKGVTLTKQQRKRALELERLRQSTIMTSSDYQKNPFNAIRKHAQNTLLSHENPGKL
ncbi:unnamed protein product [Rhizoctonia solani]|uniref:Ribosome biogenesis protein SLX9 n=1 Tax=Rhizoctonia solani TaxID=456999 RepID=A0A8H3HL33_9AGAM|nr:unnamed protein product [Rhizoctonia solani]CAE7213989.1 unnamed protein product [Rhizoctonia solani]